MTFSCNVFTEIVQRKEVGWKKREEISGLAGSGVIVCSEGLAETLTIISY